MIGRMPSNAIATFNPIPWQVAPWRDTSPVVLLTGSAGGGKSRVAAEKLHGFCLRYPGSTALMLRKARESMTNSTVIFVDRKIITGSDPRVRHMSSKSRFEYANSSVLTYGGMFDDKQREQIRSIGQDGSVDIVWMEEANRFTEDDFNEIRARMRGKAAPWTQIVLSCNPDAPTHWIYKRLIERGEATVYYSGALDNPYNPPAYIESLKSLTGVLGMRLRDGKWVQAEGAVYEDYDPSLHVVDPFDIPADWRRMRVVDFGYTNPFVCQWWAFDGDGRMYLYREVYMSQRTVRAHSEQITRLSQGERTERTVADHDAEDRATLQENKISTEAATKDISPGIQKVAARLKSAGDGKPRLFILRGCTVETDWRMEETKRPTSTEEEFPGYVWPKSADGKTVKETPVKDNDHGMDAMRYAVMYADSPKGTLTITKNPLW